MDPHDLSSEPASESSILVGVTRHGEGDFAVRDSLDELAELSTTAGVAVRERFVVRLREPNPAHFIGRGKVEELGRLAAATGANVLIFDDDLSPVQSRNIEELAGVRVVDRTQVILDIFARRAQTAEGRLQIELAQLEYTLPRLRGMWTHLERQKGGIGLRGPGEQQIELDRRRIENRIVRIRNDIRHVRARREELRRGRRRHGWALVCLVGYTNAGKSTLLNALSGANVMADPKLFATLDPTTRKIELPNHQPALLTDTVGFIRKLPHRLVDAFQATLEEAAVADLLVHVMDAAHPQVDAQTAAVRAVLREIGAHQRPCIEVWNKTDLPAGAARVRGLETGSPGAVALSARTGAGLDALRDAVADRLKDRSVEFEALIPLADGRTQALIRQSARLESQEYTDDGLHVTGRIPARLLGVVAPFAVRKEEGDDGRTDERDAGLSG